MLQEMNDRHNATLAMMGLVKSLLALDTQKSMVSEYKAKERTWLMSRSYCIFYFIHHLFSEKKTISCSTRFVTSNNRQLA